MIKESNLSIALELFANVNNQESGFVSFVGGTRIDYSHERINTMLSHKTAHRSESAEM